MDTVSPIVGSPDETQIESSPFAVKKLLHQQMLHRYRVQDHSQSALLQLINRSRSPSALQAIATLDAEQAELFNRIVTRAHRYYTVRELLRKLEGRHGIDRDDLHQDGLITLLEVTKQTPYPPGSVEFQRIFLQATKRDLLDQLRFFGRRKAKAKWEYVRTTRVQPEEGGSSEDPSVEKVGLYHRPPSPFRTALITEALDRLVATTNGEAWKLDVLRDLVANADLFGYADAEAETYYLDRFSAYDFIPRTAVYDRHQVSRRSRDRFRRDLQAALPKEDRLALLESSFSHGSCGPNDAGEE